MLPVRVHTPMTIHQKFYCEYVGAWHLHPQFQLLGVKTHQDPDRKTNNKCWPEAQRICHRPQPHSRCNIRQGLQLKVVSFCLVHMDGHDMSMTCHGYLQ